jgi:hypothetical protein
MNDPRQRCRSANATSAPPRSRPEDASVHGCCSPSAGPVRLALTNTPLGSR